MRLAARLALIVGVIGLGAHAATAATILPAGSAWQYTFTDPTADPNWHWNGAWSVGLAPFGNCASPCPTMPDFAYNTFWAPDAADGDDLWVRQTVDLTGFDLSTIAWGLGVDNGFTLYVNGHFVDAGNHDGWAVRWEYPLGGYRYPDHPRYIDPAFLIAGLNVISLALEDHGGDTGFDMEVSGTPFQPFRPIPEPASMFLLAIGAAAALRRARAGRVI